MENSLLFYKILKDEIYTNHFKKKPNILHVHENFKATLATLTTLKSLIPRETLIKYLSVKSAPISTTLGSYFRLITSL